MMMPAPPPFNFGVKSTFLGSVLINNCILPYLRVDWSPIHQNYASSAGIRLNATSE